MGTHFSPQPWSMFLRKLVQYTIQRVNYVLDNSKIKPLEIWLIELSSVLWCPQMRDCVEKADMLIWNQSI